MKSPDLFTEAETRTQLEKAGIVRKGDRAGIAQEYAQLQQTLSLGRPLSIRQTELLGEAVRRFEERGNDKKAKVRQSLMPRAGGPARRSGGRSYGTIGARYAGLNMRIDHFFTAQNKAKFGSV